LHKPLKALELFKTDSIEQCSSLPVMYDRLYETHKQSAA